MTSKTVKLAGAFAGVCILAASALAADRRDTARSSAAKSVILGKTKNYPDPACSMPRNCQVIARVTGIQMMADGTRRPFQATKDGQIVSWWLRLPKLTESQINSFNKLFGGEPSARLAVLRKGIKSRFRLVRQSETVQLRDKLGNKGRTRFKIATPLAVKQGDYVALSAVTWLPSFAVGLGASRNSWIASRPKSRCVTPSSRDAKKFERYYKRSDAQVDPGAKPYECSYETARLIYWARLVPTEEPATPPATP